MADVQIGDMISVPGRIGIIRHLGIFAGFANGVASVIHNSKQQRRVVVERWDLFAEGKPVKIERRAVAGFGDLVVRAALQWLGTEYDLMGFNCEHFVTAVHDGRAKSPQLAGWTAAGSSAFLRWRCPRAAGPRTTRAWTGIAIVPVASRDADVPDR